ncbi:MAG: ABC transporter ATP-binding protein [Planctomycetes bacterium]|nr:ABC transporter ATP-binding protein [Planctomycetota bacterium]
MTAAAGEPGHGQAVPLVEFERVTKWYGAIAALTDVSFAVGTEVVGLVGRNGVGKSTLMKLAAGLLRPSQGAVRVLGHAAGSRAARALLGFCPDLDRLFEPLRGREFVAWMLRYHGLSRRQARSRAAEVLDELGLGSHMHRRIREYSKGMRQRVRLAQAIAHRPRVVLLDEPMTGLDPLARSELAATIVGLPRQGVGVLVSSHVLHELEAIAPRVVLVHQGRLLAEGRVADLRDQLPGRPKAYRIVAAEPRSFAARLLELPGVEGVAVADAALRVTVRDAAAFLAAVTPPAAVWPGGVRELMPLEDDLATVFEHLVG